MITQQVDDFLRESNAIENVFDEKSLQQARYTWAFLKIQKHLTKGTILKAHKFLMLDQPLRPNEKGYLRRIDVTVGGRYLTRWESVSFLLDEWIDRIEKIKDFPYTKKDAETLSQSLHVQFENIHPFVDGNGRIGRILMNWIRIKYLKLPILIIKASERQAYYEWFK